LINVTYTNKLQQVKMSFNFIDIIPHEYEFERMQDQNKKYTSMSYDEFLEWNEKCFAEASEADIIFIKEVYKRINKKQIILMDMEFCSEYSACGIYFDHAKSICMYCPR